MHQMPRQTVFILTLAAAVLLALAAAGAEPGALTITPNDNGRTFQMRVGEDFQAQVTLEGDEEVVVPEFDPFVLGSGFVNMKSTSGPKGAIVTVTYKLTVKKEGRTELIIPVKGPGKTSRPKPRLKVKIAATNG